MGVRRREQNEHSPPGNWDWEAKISRKRKISTLILITRVNFCNDSLPISHSHCTRVRLTARVTCSDELAIHLTRFFACRGRLRNSGANYFTVGLFCVTITWQQIFEDALEVTVVDIGVRRGTKRAGAKWELILAMTVCRWYTAQQLGLVSSSDELMSAPLPAKAGCDTCERIVLLLFFVAWQ